MRHSQPRKATSNRFFDRQRVFSDCSIPLLFLIALATGSGNPLIALAIFAPGKSSSLFKACSPMLFLSPRLALLAGMSHASALSDAPSFLLNRIPSRCEIGKSYTDCLDCFIVRHFRLANNFLAARSSETSFTLTNILYFF